MTQDGKGLYGTAYRLRLFFRRSGCERYHIAIAFFYYIILLLLTRPEMQRDVQHTVTLLRTIKNTSCAADP
jgi:hypothetical protein